MTARAEAVHLKAPLVSRIAMHNLLQRLPGYTNNIEVSLPKVQRLVNQLVRNPNFVLKPALIDPRAFGRVITVDGTHRTIACALLKIDLPTDFSRLPAKRVGPTGFVYWRPWKEVRITG